MLNLKYVFVLRANSNIHFNVYRSTGQLRQYFISPKIENLVNSPSRNKYGRMTIKK